MQATLQVLEGPHRGRQFTFEGHDTFLVGRSSRAHLQLPVKDLFFSRVHFLVEINPPHCRLMDLGSHNGTRVNGKRVETIDLKHGDQIKAGHTVFRLTLANAEAEVTPVPPPPPKVPSVEDTAKAHLSAQVEDTIVMPRTVPCVSCGAGVPGKGEGIESKVCKNCQQRMKQMPQSIPGHRLIKEIGRGSLGVVYLAGRESDGRLVALKTILPAVECASSETVKFLYSANQLRFLDHPHLVPALEFGVAGGQLWATSEYVNGTDASRLVKKHGPLAIGRAVSLICQVLEALEYSHQRGLIHHDIKPSNLLVTRQTNREVVRLTDFGLARLYQSSPLSGLTMTGLTGAPMFMPPERVTHCRVAMPSTDQYAAAMTLYYLLTGCTGHDVPDQLQRWLRLILEEDAIPIRQRRGDIPAGLAEVIHHALSKDANGRFADARSFRKALEQYRGV